MRDKRDHNMNTAHHKLTSIMNGHLYGCFSRLPYFVTSNVLGIIFLLSATAKGFDYLLSPSYASPFQPLWYKVAVVELEFAFGLWLICGLYPRQTRWVGFLVFTVFGFQNIRLWIAGETFCGCFGRLSPSPLMTIILDFGCIFILIWTRSPSRTTKFTMQPARILMGLTILGWIGIPWAFAMRQIDGPVEIDPSVWIGRRLPILNQIEIASEIGKGRWSLVLYRHDCNLCKIEIPKFERMALELRNLDQPIRVAFIEVPPYGEREESIVSKSTVAAVGRLSQAVRWSVRTPTVIAMNDSVVLRPDQVPKAE